MSKKLLYLFLILLAGCGKGEKGSPSVFFTGEIVNPTSGHVVLYKGDDTIDSAKLDDQNRFTFRLDSISDGLYHFNHAPEYQYVYLKQGDSLAIRLNTVAFDESLVFSGTGEEINNFLLELFLANEDENATIYSSFRLEPEEFTQKLDSLAAQKLEQLDNLKSEGGLTDKEVKIAKASIVYEYNSFKERYPFVHRKYTKDKKIRDLPDNFYDYRKNLSFGDSDLTYLRPYYNFMNNHFGNVSYMSCSEKCDVKNDEVKNYLHFNKHKLKLIDSIVEEKELKDNLFRKVAIDYLLKAHDTEENNEVFIEQFHKLSNNNRHIKEIDELYQGIRNIQPNKDIPEVLVNNTEGIKVSLKDISKDKKTVFYFWSGSDKRHFNEVTKRIMSLASRKPDYSLVGINIRTEEANWRGMLQTANLDPSTQYRSENFDELTRALIIYPINKCIIAEDGKIVNAFCDIFSGSLEKEMISNDKLAKN
ncbi:MAG: transaldolase [Aurantibacter sp.]